MTSLPENRPLLPIPKGVNEPAGGHSAFTKDGSRLLYMHNGPTAPGDLWVYHLATGKSQQITHSLVGGRALGRHGRAVSGALSQPRRQVDHLRISLRALQHGAQRAECRHRLHSRRPDVADHEFVQPLHAVRRESGIHGARAQLSRLDRIWQGISAGESYSTWAAAICRTCWRASTGSSRPAISIRKRLRSWAEATAATSA